jgi:hypothetical protein
MAENSSIWSQTRQFFSIFSKTTKKNILTSVPGQRGQHVHEALGEHDGLGGARLPVDAQPGRGSHRAGVHLPLLRPPGDYIFYECLFRNQILRGEMFALDFCTKCHPKCMYIQTTMYLIIVDKMSSTCRQKCI